jgi:hypothetical protein
MPEEGDHSRPGARSSTALEWSPYAWTHHGAEDRAQQACVESMLADLPTPAGISDNQRDPSQIETVLRQRGVAFVNYCPARPDQGR